MPAQAGIQYTPAVVKPTIAAAYWIVRSSRTMTVEFQARCAHMI
jgi:hypothetical protein